MLRAAQEVRPGCPFLLLLGPLHDVQPGVERLQMTSSTVSNLADVSVNNVCQEVADSLLVENILEGESSARKQKKNYPAVSWKKNQHC